MGAGLGSLVGAVGGVAAAGGAATLGKRKDPKYNWFPVMLRMFPALFSLQHLICFRSVQSTNRPEKAVQLFILATLICKYDQF